MYAQAAAPSGLFMPDLHWEQVSVLFDPDLMGSDGDRRVCGTAICGYRYRFHPAESPLFERCIGLSWCSGCRVYMATRVYVPRDEALTDALVELPVDRQEQLKRS